MSTKHTPGPWIIQWGRQGTQPLSIHNNDVNIVTGMGRKAHPEAVQNARLIAAAPDLLEALQAVASYGSMTGADWVCEKVDAAIAKATGSRS